MKKPKHLVLTALLLLPSAGFCQDGAPSFGIGVGHLYYGLGANYQFSSPNLNNYISLGCPHVGHGGDSGFVANCGVGYSLITAALSQSGKHGIGGNIGASHAVLGQREGFVYHLGINYTYFFNGIGREGWNLQVAPAIEYFGGGYSPTGFFGFGYQI